MMGDIPRICAEVSMVMTGCLGNRISGGIMAAILLPRLMHVGAAAIEQLPAALRQAGLSRPLIVTDRFFAGNGALARVEALLQAAGIASRAFTDAVPDPTSSSVDAVVAFLKAGEHDCVIGFGGGSPIDTAKAAAVLAVRGGAMRDLKAPHQEDTPALPIVAIPTTAGTGSEATRFTIVTDDATDEKMLCAGAAFMPTIAIVDYEFTLSKPRRLTADTGIDALTHAIEAYVSRRANPFSDGMALSAMRIIWANLRTACDEPGNRAAREGMMLGALQAGIAFSNASVTGRLALASNAEVDRAVAAALRAFAGWAATPPPRRAALLFRFRELLVRDADRLAAIVTAEHGKTLEDARGEVQRGIEVVEFACGIPSLLKGELSEQVGRDIDSYSMRQPLGVCAGITPFNFPAMVPMWMFPVALACGNTFVLKPSEKDPSLALELAALLAEAGLPNGVFNVVNGDRTAVEALLANPEVAAVSFVGSTPIAESVYRRGAESGKRVQALGGAKNHMVVLPDADLEMTARRANRRGLWFCGRALHGDLGRRGGRPGRVRGLARAAIGRARSSAAHRAGRRAWRRDGTAGHGRASRARARLCGPRRTRGRDARRRRARLSRRRLARRLLSGRLSLRSRNARDAHLSRGNLRPRALHAARCDARRSAALGRRARVRQRRRDLHARRRRRARLRAQRPRRHGRHQRADSRADGLPQFRRLEAFDLRRPRDSRPRRRALLHAHKNHDRALALRARRLRVLDAGDGMAKPMPTEPPLGEKIAVLMPMTSPAMLKVGPPELPRLIEASICRKSS
jgi:alcohol dehydrogenase class IV